MQRIIILGSSGAGKTTLAKALSSTLRIKVFHLDRLFWYHRWKRKISYDRIALLERLALANKQWIVEGNYLKSLETCLMEADTIIVLNLPPPVCLWRIIKRHYEFFGRSRRDIPEGCTDRITLWHLLEVLIFPLHGRKKVKQTLCNYTTKHIITLRSKKAVNAFLAQLEQGIDEKINFPHEVSSKRDWNLAIKLYLEFMTFLSENHAKEH